MPRENSSTRLSSTRTSSVEGILECRWSWYQKRCWKQKGQEDCHYCLKMADKSKGKKAHWKRSCPWQFQQEGAENWTWAWVKSWDKSWSWDKSIETRVETRVEARLETRLETRLKTGRHKSAKSWRFVAMTVLARSGWRGKDSRGMGGKEEKERYTGDRNKSRSSGR